MENIIFLFFFFELIIFHSLPVCSPRVTRRLQFKRDVEVGRINLPFMMRSAKNAIEKYGSENSGNSIIALPSKYPDDRFIWIKKKKK